MKGIKLSLIVVAVFVLLALAGAALAAELTGVVTAVDFDKNVLTVKTETMDVSVDCETGSLLQDIKVGDEVRVRYTEENGKKLATSVTRISPMKPVKPGY